MGYQQSQNAQSEVDVSLKNADQQVDMNDDNEDAEEASAKSLNEDPMLSDPNSVV